METSIFDNMIKLNIIIHFIMLCYYNLRLNTLVTKINNVNNFLLQQLQL